MDNAYPVDHNCSPECELCHLWEEMDEAERTELLEEKLRWDDFIQHRDELYAE